MNIYFIIYILFLHFVGDFVCQTNEQAKNKSKDNWALTEHVVNYYIVFILGLLFSNNPFLGVFLIINTVSHFIIDYFTSRLNTKLLVAARKNDNYHNFFVSIGFDQFLHTGILILTAQWLLV